MSSLPDFLLKILRDTPGVDEARGRMVIIIRQPYAYLESELRAVFEGQEDVQVIVDRRTRERRMMQQPVEQERRRAKVRRPKEGILEVAILA
jgi:hypothetical protein